jgi:hypothetical protein
MKSKVALAVVSGVIGAVVGVGLLIGCIAMLKPTPRPLDLPPAQGACAEGVCASDPRDLETDPRVEVARLRRQLAREEFAREVHR